METKLFLRRGHDEREIRVRNFGANLSEGDKEEEDDDNDDNESFIDREWGLVTSSTTNLIICGAIVNCLRTCLDHDLRYETT